MAAFLRTYLGDAVDFEYFDEALATACVAATYAAASAWQARRDKAADAEIAKMPITPLPSQSVRTNQTRTALNELTQTEAYRTWRRQHTRLLDAESVERADERLRWSAATLSSFALLAFYTIVCFNVGAGTQLDTYAGKTVLLLAVACCTAPVHAGVFTTALYMLFHALGAPLDTGFFVIVALFFTKTFAEEAVGLRQRFTPRRALEAYEKADYGAILDGSTGVH